jgi:hypothetical protein
MMSHQHWLGDNPMLSRRAALSNGLLLLALPALTRAALRGTNVRQLTITYPGGPEIKFDPTYYRDHHLELFMDIYGPAIERFELRTVQASQTFSAIINVWIADNELFKARSTEAAYKRMGDDKKNFTNTSSYVEVDEVRYEAGEKRSGIVDNTSCLSLLYPAGADGYWDDEKRCSTYVKELMSRSKAVRRVELRKGVQELDAGAPKYQGGVNIYLRDPKGLEAVRKTALELSTQLCNTPPIELDTTVFGHSK